MPKSKRKRAIELLLALLILLGFCFLGFAIGHTFWPVTHTTYVPEPGPTQVHIVPGPTVTVPAACPTVTVPGPTITAVPVAPAPNPTVTPVSSGKA